MKTQSIIFASAASLVLIAGCSTIERTQSMRFDRCRVEVFALPADSAVVAAAAIPDGGVFAQAMSADHGEGAETLTPTISPSTSATIMPRGATSAASGVATAIESAIGGGVGANADGDCADGSCSVQE